MTVDINVADLLPHDGKMVLLDKVVSYDADSMVAELVVRDDGLFGDGQYVPAWLGIEYMAQTVAAHGGMLRYLEGLPIHIGFLLGTRRFNSNVAELTVGSRLLVRVEHNVQDQGLAVFDCVLEGQGVEMSAKLNVYQPDSEQNLVLSSD